MTLNQASAQRRLAAILVADVVGYSRLMEADEVGTLAALKERRKGIVEPLVKEHSGRVVKFMGDGVLVEFASAVNALACALAIQRRMAELNEPLPDNRIIALRIGINLGDVIGEGTDIFGEGVNVAARLEGLAAPGRICIAGNVHDAVRGKIDFAAEEMGEVTLKNIARPIRAYHLQPKSRIARTSPERPVLTLPDKPSIAILPFQNMSGDPEQEYFADGMVEDITTALSRNRWLFVIARNSSFSYKGRAVDIKQVGRELGVRYVLEGSVRKAANRVRITGQLIDATSGAHLWAQRFDGQVEDVFDLQDQITTSVVGAIAPKLELAEIERIKHKPTDSLDAYDHYLRGMSFIRAWTKDEVDAALSHFYRAMEIDPQFASPYGLAARCYSQRKAGGWELDADREAAEVARLARRAIELGMDDAVALCTTGLALGYVIGDLEEANALTEMAIELNPNLAWAWYFSSWVKLWRGEPEAAIERVTNAMRLSPYDLQMFEMQDALAMALFCTGRYAEAREWAVKSLRGFSEFLLPQCVAAASAAIIGRLEEARERVAQLRAC